MFAYLTRPIREDIDELREEYSNLINADKSITTLNELLQTLARQFAISENVSIEDKQAALQASLTDAKARYKALKQRVMVAPASADTARLEDRLTQAGKQVAALSSELQRLLVSQIPKGHSASGR